MSEHADYFNYLRSRGRLGLLYRRYFLYPQLTRCLSGRILDVGCGIGDFLAFRPGTVGVDVNSHAVEWCRKHGWECHAMDPDRLPFEDANFDGVMLDNVLEHLTDPQPLLMEIRRVLVAGGCLVVGVPGTRGYECDPDHKVFYGESDLKRALGTAGFTVGKTIHTPFKNRWLASRLAQYCLYGVFRRP